MSHYHVWPLAASTKDYKACEKYAIPIQPWKGVQDITKASESQKAKRGESAVD